MLKIALVTIWGSSRGNDSDTRFAELVINPPRIVHLSICKRFNAGSRKLRCYAASRVLKRGTVGWAVVRVHAQVAIQLKDTHPTLVIAELIRIVLDDEHLGRDQ